MIDGGAACKQLFHDGQAASYRRDHDRTVAVRVSQVDFGAGSEQSVEGRLETRARGDQQHRIAIRIDRVRVDAAREECRNLVGSIDGDGMDELLVELLRV